MSRGTYGNDSLKAYAEGAGLALACAYSSSDEFDAALIAERRAAGIYGPKRQRRRFAAYSGIAAGIATVFAVIFLF